MTSENLSHGAYVVTPGLHCVLASSLNWKYSASSLSRYSVNIPHLYVLPNVSVPFIVPSAPTTTSMVRLKEVEKFMFAKTYKNPYRTSGSNHLIYPSVYDEFCCFWWFSLSELFCITMPGNLSEVKLVPFPVKLGTVIGYWFHEARLLIKLTTLWSGKGISEVLYV